MAKGKNKKKVVKKKKAPVKRKAVKAKKVAKKKVVRKAIKKAVKPAKGKKVSAKKSSQLESKANALILRGKERGYVTYNEILKEFPTIEDNVMFLEDLYERLSTSGIDVLESGGMLEEVPDEVVMRGGYRGEGSAHGRSP
jgi:2,3-bisphosphoglycerate-independent phosphoglycerate mutase